MITETEYNIEPLKRKLLITLVILVVVNMLLLQIGPGLGGNYLKHMDSMLWAAPLGCIIWAFLASTLLTLTPFKGLPYKRKYLITSLFISIVFNIFLLLGGIAMLFG